MITTRTDYINGLLMLADLLAANDDLPIPYIDGPTWGAWGPDAKAEVARIARIVPGKLDKSHSDDTYYRLAGKLGSLNTKIVAYREAVCEAITTVETVTVVEQDPDLVAAALAKIPEVEVTREVETVEWVCSPLLADAEQVA